MKNYFPEAKISRHNGTMIASFAGTRDRNEALKRIHQNKPVFNGYMTLAGIRWLALGCPGQKAIVFTFDKARKRRGTWGR